MKRLLWTSVISNGEEWRNGNRLVQNVYKDLPASAKKDWNRGPIWCQVFMLLLHVPICWVPCNTKCFCYYCMFTWVGPMECKVLLCPFHFRPLGVLPQGRSLASFSSTSPNPLPLSNSPSVFPCLRLSNNLLLGLSLYFPFNCVFQ